MTNSSPPNPQPSEISPEERRIRNNIRKRAYRENSEEWIAGIVAFGTIGAILFASLGGRKSNFDLSQGNFLSSSNEATETEANFDLDRNSQDFVNTDNSDSLNISPFSADIQVEDTRSSDVLSGSLTKDKDKKKSNFISSLPLAASIPSVAKAVIPKPEPELVVPELEIAEPEPEVVTPEPEIAISEPEVVVPEAEVAEPEPEVVAFANLDQKHWVYPFASKLGEEKLLPNTRGFKPDEPITRAEMASLISSAFKDDSLVESPKQFTDISANNSDINKAVSLGFMNGYSEGDFRPEQNIPRYQVLVALATGLKLEPSKNPKNILRKFKDRKDLPEWSLNQVAAATEAKLAVNRPGLSLKSLNPDEPATRAEVAAMIYQSLANQGKLPEIKSKYIVPKR